MTFREDFERRVHNQVPPDGGAVIYQSVDRDHSNGRVISRDEYIRMIELRVLVDLVGERFAPLHELQIAAARFREIDAAHNATQNCPACLGRDVWYCSEHEALGHLFVEASNALEEAARKT